MASMSDSLIACQPRIDEPSKPDAVLERPLVEVVDGVGAVLPGAEHVAELQVDLLGLVILGEGHEAGRGRGLGSLRQFLLVGHERALRKRLAESVRPDAGDYRRSIRERNDSRRSVTVHRRVSGPSPDLLTRRRPARPAKQQRPPRHRWERSSHAISTTSAVALSDLTLQPQPDKSIPGGQCSEIAGW